MSYICRRIDATKDDGSLGRLVNHSRLPVGRQPKTHGPKTPPKQNAHVIILKNIEKRPRLLYIASRDIAPGEEVLFDYGERRPEVIAKNPWLKPEPHLGKS
jgi:histone-lysine N-methyltransferase SETD8